MEEKKHDRKFLPSMMTHEVSKLFRDIINREVEKLGIQNSYRQLLFCLGRKDGVNQLELVRETHLKAPTISVTLKSMEADGLVVRKTDENDARVIHVYLTEKGRQTDDRIRDIHHELDRIMAAGIPQEELDALVSTLKKMRDNMLKITAEGKTQ
ncbi:MAG: MarR family winged helix-turn-helix transcriptional regulator [Eubacteriales bacterium]